MRQITRETLLYTEMTMDAALNYNSQKLDAFLGHDEIEYPLALQLGGCDPKSLGAAAYLAEGYGAYESINLNAGCPSNRAKKAGFGAELMLEPDLVKEIVHEMKRNVTHTDVTVKCRLGVTDRESWENLKEFIHVVSEGGVRHVIVHARTCVLKGLSPAQNRTVPPLRPEVVHDLVREFPEMKFTINGGIRTFSDAKRHLGWGASDKGSFDQKNWSINENSSSTYVRTDSIGNNITNDNGQESVNNDNCQESVNTNEALIYDIKSNKRIKLNDGYIMNNYVHGVMIGREAYNNPFLFATADTDFFRKSETATEGVLFETGVRGTDKTDPDSGVNPYPKGLPVTRREVLEEYIDYATKCQDRKVYGSNICNIMKPLHNFFNGFEDNKPSISYKRKLDELLKRLNKNSNKNMISNVSTFESVVWEAIEGTIDKNILDCNFRI